MSTPFNFTEVRNEVFYHNIRIFIHGADVTPWLTSSVSYTYVDRDGISSARFTLSNAMQSFEITDANLNNKFRHSQMHSSIPYTTAGRYSEQAKWEIYQIKQKANQTGKHEINTFGPIATGSTGAVTLSDSGSSLNANQTTSTVTYRYPFNVGSLVFHKYDQIRIFEADPHSRSSDKWRCVYTGYIDVKPYTTDYVTGESFVEISAVDIRAKMNNMRVQANPAANISNENAAFFRGNPTDTIKDDPNAGFFNDLIGGNFTISHVLGNLTWLDSVKFLIFGIDKSNAGDVKNANLQGVGQFQFNEGNVIKYEPSKSDSSSVLEDWNNLILFSTPKTWLTQAQMMTIGQQTYDGGANSADASQVYFLLPSDGSPPSSLINFSMGPQINAKVEWSTRLELLVHVCKAIDYQFYINGYGDMIFEFPMYDFLPTHFGPVYGRVYTFSKGLTKNTINDEGGTPISSLRVTSSNLNETTQIPGQNANANVGFEKPFSLVRTIYSNVLASRIGVHMETHDVPGITDQGRLTQIGMIEFNKRIANFDQFDINATYRPFLFLNRPIYNQIKQRVGISRNVGYTYAIRDQVTISMSLEYVRKKEQGSNGAFRFITGGEAVPISYSKIYDKVAVEKQGVGSTAGGASGTNDIPDTAKNNDVGTQ